MQQQQQQQTHDDATTQAGALMTAFAKRTGLSPSRSAQQRYLWTDAFAVCNFIGLARATQDVRYRELAVALVDRVHHILGRHRPDARQSGWISGLPETDGEAHPTLGGLRIGKPLPERAPGDPSNERLEWEQDGQYFHYLTKWMYALDQLARVTGEIQLDRWARELADTAHRRFIHGLPGRRRMYWKMSIDLTRPLVLSMGQHDPLDGLLTYLELEASAAAWASPASGPDLADAIADFTAMIDPRSLATADPLGSVASCSMRTGSPCWCAIAREARARRFSKPCWRRRRTGSTTTSSKRILTNQRIAGLPFASSGSRSDLLRSMGSIAKCSRVKCATPTRASIGMPR